MAVPTLLTRVLTPAASITGGVAGGTPPLKVGLISAAVRPVVAAKGVITPALPEPAVLPVTLKLSPKLVLISTTPVRVLLLMPVRVGPARAGAASAVAAAKAFSKDVRLARIGRA